MTLPPDEGPHHQVTLFERFYGALDRCLTVVLLVLVVAMVLSITTEILLNALVQPAATAALRALEDGAGSPGLEGFLRGVVGVVADISAPVNTASQTLLVWIGILGSALAFRMRAHLGVDALVRVYPPKARLFLDHLSTALVGAFSLVILVVGGWMAFRKGLGSDMPGLAMLDQGWFYLVLVITGLLNLLYCVYHFVHPRPVAVTDSEEVPPSP